MQEFKVFAPATIGNVGPGFDCFGLCVAGLGDELTGRPAREIVIKEVTGKQSEGVPTDVDKNSASIAAKHLFHALKYDGGLEISIHRNLPLSGGLGASAASALGGAMLAAAVCGLAKDDSRIVDAALAGEAAVAGRHLDNIAPCFYGGMSIVRSVEPVHIVQVPTKASWWLSVLSPRLALNTKNSRTVLPENLPTSEWVAQAANMASLVQAFITEDVQLFKSSFFDYFAEPARCSLIPGFQAVKESALEAGAMGCTISGGGPSIFAISENKEMALKVGEEMLSASATDASLHVGAICYKGATCE